MSAPVSPSRAVSAEPRAVTADTAIPRRELVTLLAYVLGGSHKAGAHRLGISESTSRRRISTLLTRIGADNVAQAVWMLRRDLEVEAVDDAHPYRGATAVPPSARVDRRRPIA